VILRAKGVRGQHRNLRIRRAPDKGNGVGRGCVGGGRSGAVRRSDAAEPDGVSADRRALFPIRQGGKDAIDCRVSRRKLSLFAAVFSRHGIQLRGAGGIARLRW
jgi:hypothetical protein